ncbi:hypothetical protein GGR52DRAFT_564403 [Hypoxylon sp. FL1284]|nr:hypothetical protein GGR52DRAFT_564403 [Hypoxylon sp. FL1284]
MATYVVTGVSKGIGYALLTELTMYPENTVIGLVRDTATTLKKISEDPQMKGRTNFHIIKGDLVDYGGLKKAVADVSTITGGAIDYLIGNAGYVSLYDAYDPIGDLNSANPKETAEDLRRGFEVNAIGQMNLITLFLPLILKGKAKKVIAISSGMADADLVAKYEVYMGSLYSTSKAALNMIIAKFHAQYKKDGVLFLSLSPGVVDVGKSGQETPEQLEKMGAMFARFQKYQPDFTGPITPDVSVRCMKNVWESKSVENGDGGLFLSHLGTKQWI